MGQAKSRLITYMFGAAVFLTLFLVLCYAPFAEYAYKRETDLPNILLLAAAIVIMALLYAFICKFQNKLGMIFGKGYAVSGLLFSAELYRTCNAYFRTGWDAGDCMLPSAIELSYGHPVSNTAYFSMYPNNVVLLWIQSKVHKYAWRFSIFDGKTGMMSLIAFNCLLSVISVLFQLLFEARARYVYCYVPVMLVLAVLGFAKFAEKIKNSIKIFEK